MDTRPLDLSPAHHALVGALTGAGARVLLVGGAVRDLAMGQPTHDLDFEVYGLASGRLREVLAPFGPPLELGVSFGVLQLVLDGRPLHLNLPRRESRAGRGHRGFLVEVDPTLSPREAAARRDFTWNAMAIDLATDEFLDPFGGLDDLSRRVIRHVGPAFVEDPLRVLRAMQFAARFDFTLASETARLCESLAPEFHDLALERVWMEWAKWAERGRVPSRGLEVLRETRWIGHFPELAALAGCAQEPRHHPEGDVWVHTGLVCDAAARIAERDGITGDARRVLMFAALAHDVGKPAATVMKQGRITSAGHERSGVALALSLLARVGFPPRLAPRVAALVSEHMTHLSIGPAGPSERGVRRLARRLADAGETLALLGALIEADHSGRPPLPGGMPAMMRRVLELGRELTLLGSGPEPLLLGRHLLELGIAPGPAMGRLLAAAMEAQLDGEFADLSGARAWARRHGAGLAGGSGPD